jgi:hypothetical protein
MQLNVFEEQTFRQDTTYAGISSAITVRRGGKILHESGWYHAYCYCPLLDNMPRVLRHNL